MKLKLPFMDAVPEKPKEKKFQSPLEKPKKDKESEKKTLSYI
jgi:hypothetical protein